MVNVASEIARSENSHKISCRYAHTQDLRAVATARFLLAVTSRDRVLEHARVEELPERARVRGVDGGSAQLPSDQLELAHATPRAPLRVD